MVYNTDGTLGVYSTDLRTIWTEGTVHTPGRLKLTDGALVAYTAQGLPAWNRRVHGRGPYTLGVADTGSVELKGARGTVLWSTAVDAQPGIAAELSQLFGRVVRGKLEFGSREGTRFTLDSRSGKKCDLDAVAELCGADCPGFLYSESDATWQPLTSKASDYRHSDTLQYVGLKRVKVAVPSCSKKDAEVITDFGTPVGVVSRCGPPEAEKTLPRVYEEAAGAEAAAEEALASAMERTRPKLDELEEASEVLDPTAAQQAEDWRVMNTAYNTRAVLWCLLLVGVGVVVVVVLRRSKK